MRSRYVLQRGASAVRQDGAGRYVPGVAISTGGVLGEHGPPAHALRAVMRRISQFAPRASEEEYTLDLGFYSWSPGLGPPPPGSPDFPGVRPWMVGRKQRRFMSSWRSRPGFLMRLPFLVGCCRRLLRSPGCAASTSRQSRGSTRPSHWPEKWKLWPTTCPNPPAVPTRWGAHSSLGAERRVRAPGQSAPIIECAHVVPRPSVLSPCTCTGNHSAVCSV
jgi:hypothetical protein